nr:hypothetical protein [uncultured Methanoregula sp.]
MWPCRDKSLSWVFVSRMTGIICFLIVVVLANILKEFIRNPTLLSGIEFLNTNFWLLLVIGIIIFVADIFAAFPFPLNLPFPVIKAVGSVFIVAFVLRIFEWVDMITANNLYHYFWLLSFVIVPLVFILVLVTGYFEIMRNLWWTPHPEGEAAIVHDPAPSGEPGKASDVKSWEEIGDEFRLMLYDLVHRFRDEIRRK